MAHFAKLDSNNNVVSVIVVDNPHLIKDGVEDENTGIAFLNENVPLEEGYSWKQTSYNANFRANFARPGGYYDPVKDAFIDPKPYTNWVLNDATNEWEPPVAKPADAGTNNIDYYWDQQSNTWIQFDTTSLPAPSP